MDIGRAQGSSVHAGWAGCSHLMGGRLVGPLAVVVGDVCGSSGRRRRGSSHKVDLGIVTWSTDLDFARRTPAKCGEAGESVSERHGNARRCARAVTGKRRSVARSSQPVRRPPLR